ncbi:MAG: type I 3-dehydroquinate dehydratase [Lachnospiraceae bacterium]|nr:type I 3-dehydroquinate dehydratase [Lachnospiraceae bacterium]
MKPLKLRNLIIGNGIPKICVPIVASSKKELQKELAQYKNRADIDLIEWRGDFLPEAGNLEFMTELAKLIRHTLPDFPLLFTFRTKKEGGEQDITFSDYKKLNLTLAQSNLVDMIDLELFCTSNTEELTAFVNQLHHTGVKIVFSNHDFSKTPEESIILSRLAAMEELGADIAKIALMPQTATDVVTLLSATVKAESSLNIPVVTMSMGKLGIISRISGGTFGSAITFGSLTKSSAPGQLQVDKLKDFLVTLS